jgi:ABC-2 type transport system permease protein
MTAQVSTSSGSARASAANPALASSAAVWPVAWAMARRSTVGTLRIPASVVPMIVMPLFFVVAFGGAFSAVTMLPGFPTSNILNWVAPFAVLQGASFAGFGSAYSVGRDLENGFYDRLLMAPTRRVALMLGALLYSAMRAMVPVVIVVPAVLLAGVTIDGGLAGVAMLVVAAVGVAIASGMWGLGVVYRTRTQRAGGLIQVGIFAAMFLSIGTVPLSAMEGTWLYWVARLNPITQVLELARSGFVGQVAWAEVWPGLVALAFMFVVLGTFAWRAFRRLDQ